MRPEQGDLFERRAIDEAVDRTPIVRTDDPPTSQLAAARIEPKRGTRMAAVLAHLREQRGLGDGWVDGWMLTRPEVGGSEGLRRLRELVQNGWPIEKRPGAGTTWQYRLDPEPAPAPAPTDEWF